MGMRVLLLKLAYAQNISFAQSQQSSKNVEENVIEIMMELSRQQTRKRILDQFKYVRTCALARELCLLVRTHRAVLNKEDVRDCCSLIAGLCREAGCMEPSELCEKAAAVVMESEEKYLELCEQSCKKCSESRQPARQIPERSAYVA